MAIAYATQGLLNRAVRVCHNHNVELSNNNNKTIAEVRVIRELVPNMANMVPVPNMANMVPVPNMVNMVLVLNMEAIINLDRILNMEEIPQDPVHIRQIHNINSPLSTKRPRIGEVAQVEVEKEAKTETEDNVSAIQIYVNFKFL